MKEEINIRVSPAEAASQGALQKYAERAAAERGERLNEWRIVRRSIDARQKRVAVNLTLRLALGDDQTVGESYQPAAYKDVREAEHTVVIVGAGPAGLFAALRALELGIRPIVLERGDDVKTRRQKLADISRKGELDPECNYSFGEGGAGAYSDGKLYTRSKKRGNVRQVLETFCRHGASEDILVDAHPHIGSDRLPGIIASMREAIVAHGGEVRFRAHVDDLIPESGEIRGVSIGNEEVRGDAVVLATGHSARDIYRLLHRRGVGIESKGLAIGVRLEHPQELIDRIQYHSASGRGQWLPAADYSFVTQADGRGVYSFCMCPGGVVVPAATGPDQLVVNGMSASARSSQWANSGMVVEIHPGDFPEYSGEGPLEMMALQEALEKQYYDSAGKTFNAPAQRMTDFVAGKASKDLPRSSYPCGIHPARVDRLLPEFISKRLAEGFRTFGRQRRGFLSPEGVLIGLESRTSSPVRVPRDPMTLEHPEVKGLYPAGEGAGYAGGIASAAIDGIRCIDAFYNSLSNK